MLVTIDESGDSGFKIAKGSSPVFVVAMILFNTFGDAETTAAAIKEVRAAEGFNEGYEFKFNKTSNRLRDRFFTNIAHCPFSVRAIFIDKKLIYSAHIRADKTAAYNYFLKSLMRFDGNRLADAVVKIDGSGDRTFRKALASYLRRQLPQGVVREIKFKDSRSDVLIQLADMCAGAIARGCRKDDKRDTRWRGLLGQRIDDVWEFG